MPSVPTYARWCHVEASQGCQKRQRRVFFFLFTTPSSHFHFLESPAFIFFWMAMLVYTHGTCKHRTLQKTQSILLAFVVIFVSPSHQLMPANPVLGRIAPQVAHSKLSARPPPRVSQGASRRNARLTALPVFMKGRDSVSIIMQLFAFFGYVEPPGLPTPASVCSSASTCISRSLSSLHASLSLSLSFSLSPSKPAVVVTK